MLGTTHARIRNMLEGVTNGYQKRLNLVGVGYRAAVNNNVLEMSLGFSHPVNYPLPDGVTASITVNTKITATPSPSAVETRFDTAMKEHMPRKKASAMFSTKIDVTARFRKCSMWYPESEGPDHFPGGASRLASLLLGRIRPVCSLVAPCQTGAALQKVCPRPSDSEH